MRIAPFATKLSFPQAGFGTQAAGGGRTATSATYKTRHRALADATEIRAVFTGAVASGSGVEDAANELTVAYSIVAPGGAIHRARVGGALIWTVPPGETIITDPILDLTLAELDYFHGLTYVAGPTPGAWNGTIQYDPSGDGQGIAVGANATATDAMDASPPLDLYYAYTPSSILGTVPDDVAAVAHYGDSLTAENSLQPAMVSQVCDPLNVPHVRLAISGDRFQASGAGLAGDDGRRASLAAGCDVAICQLGVNDLLGVITLATLQANAILGWEVIRGGGASELYQTTITPISTGGASTQTTHANNGVRVAFNEWLRAGAPMIAGAAVAPGTPDADTAGSATHPLTGHIEIAYWVEDYPNSGLWRPPLYQDGVHPNSAGVTAMAVALDKSRAFRRAIGHPLLIRSAAMLAGRTGALSQ